MALGVAIGLLGFAAIVSALIVLPEIIDFARFMAASARRYLDRI